MNSAAPPGVRRKSVGVSTCWVDEDLTTSTSSRIDSYPNVNEYDAFHFTLVNTIRSLQ